MSVVNPAYKKCCFEQKNPPVTGEKSFIYTKASLKFTLFGIKTKKSQLCGQAVNCDLLFDVFRSEKNRTEHSNA